MRNLKLPRAVEWLSVLLLTAALLAVSARLIKPDRLVMDSSQNVLMAINLERHGVMSADDDPPYRVSDYREPLPVAASALVINLVDHVAGVGDAESYLEGRRGEYLKEQNLFWLALLSIGAYCAVRWFTGSRALGLLGIVLVQLPFLWTVPEFVGPVDELGTEIPASALLMWASLALAAGLGGRLAWIAAGGLLLGLFTLVKATGLYVAVAMAVLWLGFRLYRREGMRLSQIWKEIGLLVGTCACVVVPWMARNYFEIGKFEVSQRAGVVLMMRGMYDQMTPQEYLGAYYVFAPHALQRPLGGLLGYTAEDLQRGGRLQRLNEIDSDFSADDLAAERAGHPEQAISLYRRARAERVQLEQALRSAGHPEPESEADGILKARAMAIITAHPWRHLAATPLFLWRGSARVFPLLIIALAVALRYRRYDLVAFSLPALGLIVLYALFTHFIDRYSLPSRAIAVVAIIVAARLLWSALTAGRRLTTVEAAAG